MSLAACSTWPPDWLAPARTSTCVTCATSLTPTPSPLPPEPQNLTGAIDPNGVVAGEIGQLYIRIVGDGSAQIFINVDGGTTWF